MRHKKGFTLIELVMVIVILGIIGAIGAGVVYPILNLFFHTPRQLTSEQVGNMVVDEIIQGSPSAKGLRIMKNIVSANDTSITYLDVNNILIILSWDSLSKKITKTTSSEIFTLPKEYTNNSVDINGTSSGIIFKYYNSAGTQLATPVALPSSINRIQMDWILQTNSGNVKDYETKYIINSGVFIKQY